MNNLSTVRRSLVLLVFNSFDVERTNEGRTLHFVDFHWCISADVFAVPAAASSGGVLNVTLFVERIKKTVPVHVQYGIYRRNFYKS